MLVVARFMLNAERGDCGSVAAIIEQAGGRGRVQGDRWEHQQYSTVQGDRWEHQRGPCSIIQYSTVKYSIVQYSAVQRDRWEHQLRYTSLIIPTLSPAST